MDGFRPMSDGFRPRVGKIEMVFCARDCYVENSAGLVLIILAPDLIRQAGHQDSLGLTALE